MIDESSRQSALNEDRGVTIQVDDIVLKLGKLLGRIAFEVNEMELLEPIQQPMIDIYKAMCLHDEADLRLSSAYNLPCFYSLFHMKQESLGIDFMKIMSEFSRDQVFSVRHTLAVSLHEAFKIAHPCHDTGLLRKCAQTLLDDPEKEIQFAILQNLATIIKYFYNDHAINNYERNGSKEQTPMSNNSKGTSAVDSFSQLVNQKSGSKEERKTPASFGSDKKLAARKRSSMVAPEKTKKKSESELADLTPEQVPLT